MCRSILELVYDDFKLKSLESTSTNFRVESLVGYFKLELFMANSRLEIVVELKFPTP
jgi:hypothetical protein